MRMNRMLSALALMTAQICTAQPNDNLGIGTSTPVAALTVLPNTGFPSLRVRNDVNEVIMNADASGRIGIGTATADAELHLRNNFGISLLALVQRNDFLPVSLQMSNTDGRAWQFESYIPAAGVFPDGRFKINFFPYGNVLTLRGNGTVGVNTENPVNTLDVNGSLGVSGRLLPNGLPGNAGDILVSDGSGKAPVWKNVSRNEYNNFIYQSITAGGNVGGGGSGFASAANLGTFPFFVNDTTEAEVSFGLAAQSSVNNGTSYGYCDIELWQQSPALFLERHRVFFKLRTDNNGQFSTINTRKTFTLRPAFSGTTAYEFRLRINWSNNDPVRYGSLVFTSGPEGNYFHIQRIKD